MGSSLSTGHNISLLNTLTLTKSSKGTFQIYWLTSSGSTELKESLMKQSEIKNQAARYTEGEEIRDLSTVEKLDLEEALEEESFEENIFQDEDFEVENLEAEEFEAEEFEAEEIEAEEAEAKKTEAEKTETKDLK